MAQPIDQSDVIAATAFSPPAPASPVEPPAHAVNPSDVALSFAHEIGHCVGLFHRDTSRQLLMWPTTDERGGRLERDEILVAQENV